MFQFSKLVQRFLQQQRDDSELRRMDSLQENDLALNKSEVASLVHARQGVRDQLVEMARRFGVSEADIDKDRWRALEIVHACNNCAQSKSCYQFLLGGKNIGFKQNSCPNAAQYADLSGRN